QSDQPPDTVLLVGQLFDGVCRRRLDGIFCVEHTSDDVMGDGVADEDLTGAGAGNAAGPVVGVGAGTDDRGITHPAGGLVGQAPGRGASREVVVLVQCPRADGAQALVDASALSSLARRRADCPRFLFAPRLVPRELLSNLPQPPVRPEMKVTDSLD